MNYHRKFICMFVVLWHCANTANGSPISIDGKLSCGYECKATIEDGIQIEDHRKNYDQAVSVPAAPERKRRQVKNDNLETVNPPEIKSDPVPIESTSKSDAEQSPQLPLQPEGEVDDTGSVEYEKAQENLLSASERVKGSQLSSDIDGFPDGTGSLNIKNLSDGDNSASSLDQETIETPNEPSDTINVPEQPKLVSIEADEVALSENVSDGDNPDLGTIEAPTDSSEATNAADKPNLVPSEAERVTSPKQLSAPTLDLETIETTPTDSVDTINSPKNLVSADSDRLQELIRDIFVDLSQNQADLSEPVESDGDPLIAVVDSVSNPEQPPATNLKSEDDDTATGETLIDGSSNTPANLKELNSNVEPVTLIPEEVETPNVSETSIESKELPLNTVETDDTDTKAAIADATENHTTSGETTELKLNSDDTMADKTNTFLIPANTLEALGSSVEVNSNIVNTPNELYPSAPLDDTARKFDLQADPEPLVKQEDLNAVDTPKTTSSFADTTETTTNPDTSNNLSTQDESEEISTASHTAAPIEPLNSGENEPDEADPSKEEFHQIGEGTVTDDGVYFENDFEDGRDSHVYGLDDWDEHSVDENSFEKEIDDPHDCDHTDYSTNDDNAVETHYQATDFDEYSSPVTHPFTNVIGEPCGDECDEIEYSTNYPNAKDSDDHSIDYIEYSRPTYDDEYSQPTYDDDFSRHAYESRQYFDDFDAQKNSDLDLFESEFEFINKKDDDRLRDHFDHFEENVDDSDGVDDFL